MKISFTPQLRDDYLSLSLEGDVLTINGVGYDFAPLPEGAVLPAEAVDCPWLASSVTRTGGEIVLTLILPHGSDAPEAARFPQPINATDGSVALPGQEDAA